MQELRCRKCGLTLEQKGNKYVCPGCGAEYEAARAQDAAEQLSHVLDAQKQERLAALRQQLWKEFNEDYIDDEKLLSLAREIRSYLPDDFFATFCELACGKDATKLNSFLIDLDVKEHADDLEDIVRFMFKILRPRYLLAMNNLLERGAQVLGNDFYNKYYPILARESQKLEEEVYNPLLPRDVFVMYSSADMKMVISLVEELEKEGLRCFVAARNIQHGRKSDYNTILQQAMDSCKVGLFVSTTHSRNHECDALSVEMEYIRRRDTAGAPAQYRNDYAKLPRKYKKPRVEYVVESYCGRAVEKLTKELFAGFERCTSVKDVVSQIFDLERGIPDEEEEMEALRLVEEERERLAAAKRQAEEEAAALRAEIERLKAIKNTPPAEKPVLSPAPAPAPEPKPAPASGKSAKQLYAEAEELYEKEEYPKAAELYRTAAEMGYSYAQFMTGVCYDFGKGVAVDHAEAVKWYLKAAQQGHTGARYNLGYSYENGEGVAKDLSEAFKWYKQAAEQGHAKAQYAVGESYYYGDGVGRDYAEAVKWYQKAAEQGHKGAQFSLGECYY